MVWDEIEIPKDVRPIMPESAKETSLGQKNGAKRQYRYGNLHIREHEDKYLVHMDKVDPRINPFGHLVLDAPEFLVGLVGAAIGGGKMYSYLINRKNSKTNSFLASLTTSIITGYLSYSFFKKIKNF